MSDSRHQFGFYRHRSQLDRFDDVSNHYCHSLSLENFSLPRSNAAFFCNKKIGNLNKARRFYRHNSYNLAQEDNLRKVRDRRYTSLAECATRTNSSRPSAYVFIPLQAHCGKMVGKVNGREEEG